MNLLETLQNGDVASFNAKRGENRRLDLFAAELAECRLHGVDLRSANLEKSDLTQTDFTDATLLGANLCDVDGTEAIFDGVLGMQCRLRDAWLENANLESADFSRGDLRGAVVTGTKGESIRLLQAKLSEINAKGAQWPLADLSEASLKKANFSGADLSRARLVDAKASGSDFSGVNLNGADAARVKMAGINLEGATLVGANLTGANLTEANLKGADLTDAVLTGADLSGADLTGARMTRATLIDAVLDDVVVGETEWTGADLTGVDAATAGLSEDEMETLANHGASFDPDAEEVIEGVAAAHHDAHVAILWVNADTEESASVRWSLATADGKVRGGVLPVSASKVRAHDVVTIGEGFALVVLIERGSGHAVVHYGLSKDGQLSKAITTRLPYEPMVLPIYRGDATGITMWGLARRGPTVVQHRFTPGECDEEGRVVGYKPVDTSDKSQARGFLGRHNPILVTKGGVVHAVSDRGLGRPVTTPDGWPTRDSVGVPVGDTILAVWNAKPALRDPGGLRVQWLGTRHPSGVEELTEQPLVQHLDGMAVDGAVRLVWVESEGPIGGEVKTALVPGEASRGVPVGITAIDECRIIGGANGNPCIAVSSLSGRLVVCGLDGEVLATFGD